MYKIQADIREYVSDYDFMADFGVTSLASDLHNIVEARFNEEQKSDPTVDIVWQIQDIKTLRPEWTDEQCAEFLNEYGNLIQERSVEEGFEIIDACLTMYATDMDAEGVV